MIISGYKARNAFNRLRGWKAELQRYAQLGFNSELSAIFTHDGVHYDLGVLGRRVVTTVGVNYLATAFINTVEPETINYHSSGTGVAAEAIGDVALGTDSGVARATGAQSNPVAGQYRSIATQSYVSALAITEHGIWSAAAAGTLWDRTVFAAVNVVSGDAIQFTYTLTINAGG